MNSNYYGDVFGSEATAAELMQRYNDSGAGSLPEFLRSLCAKLWGEDDCNNDFDAMARQIESEAQKEQDFWGNPQTVNLYEDNAGGLYIGQSIGPWFRMDNSAGATTFAEDAAGLVAGEGEWEEPLDENPSRAGCPIVAEYRDGRTRYTFDAYTTSVAPGLAARDYVGDKAEGYEPEA